jgi:uncharacterized membrane protein
MSSSNTASNSSASASASSDKMSAALRNAPLIISSVLTVVFFITSFVMTSSALGSENTWEKIKREVMTKVWPLTLIGTLFLFITSAIYILQDPQKTMYFLLVLCCLAVGLAYSALVISVIAK